MKEVSTVRGLDDLLQRAVILDGQLIAWQKTRHGKWKFGSSERTSLELMQELNNWQPVILIFEGIEA